MEVIGFLVFLFVGQVAGLKCRPSLELEIKWNVDCSALNLSYIPPSELFNPVSVLNMSLNLLVHLTDSQFVNWTDITVLDLSANNIRNIDEKSFAGLSNLNELNIKHNYVEFLSPNITKYLPKLRVLNLSFNRLKAINPETFHYSPFLLKLFLGNNVDLGKAANNYINLNTSLKQGLITLDFSNTSLTSITINFFNVTNKLISLNLAHNPLKNIPKLPMSLRHLDISGTAIEALPLGLFIKSDVLQRLTLNDMPLLREMKANSLSGLTHLEELYIKDCPKFHFISEDAFGQSSPKLRRIALANCSLITLPSTFEPIFNKVIQLDLQNNPWVCDSRISWIVNSNISQNLSENPRCDNPPTARGMLLVDYFKPRSLHSHSRLIRAAIVIAMVAVLVGSVVKIIRHMTKPKNKAYRYFEDIGV